MTPTRDALVVKSDRRPGSHLDRPRGAGEGTRTPNHLFTSQTDSNPPGVASCRISLDLRKRPRHPCQIVRPGPSRPDSVAAFPSASLPQIPSDQPSETGDGARLGISRPAQQRRRDQGELPAPAGLSGSGWPSWRAGDIEEWITQLSLARCRICGAYLKRLGWHMISRHQQPSQRRQPQTLSILLLSPQ